MGIIDKAAFTVLPEALSRAKVPAFIPHEKLQTPQQNWAFRITHFGLDAIRPSFFNIKDVESDDFVLSKLGTRVFDSLQFGVEDTEKEKKNNYIDLDKTVKPFEKLNIQTVLLEVSQTKNIVRTVLQGRNGTIKEYISNGDYMITARGMIASENNTYPRVDVDKLIKICEMPSKVAVISGFLQGFGINDIVIDDYRFVQTEGMRNIQAFEISMSSDKEIIL